MHEIIEALKTRMAAEAAAVRTSEQLEAFERVFLGRKGEIAALTDQLKNFDPDERRKFGMALNQFRAETTALVGKLRETVASDTAQTRRPFDVTRPGVHQPVGHLHPLTQTRREVERIFASMGFHVVEGPEVETEWYNFDALNIPRFHPARELQDTFWLKMQTHAEGNGDSRGQGQDPRKRLLLRTQTSPMQVRYMERHTPPLRIIVPGRVFRYEASDASHDIQFNQVEGLMVDRAVSVAHFKAVMSAFFERLFRKETRTRLRPGYFPFVEPGFEIDVSCPKCVQKGCNLCKRSGWLELAGAGMVHQNVFVNAGYPYSAYTGFAFGIGFDRLTMVKYGIDDIRLFYGGDLRFLKQF